MPHVRCSKCNKSKQKNAFSKNQLRKAKQKRACKKCISNGQKQNLPRSNANNSSQVQLKKMQEEEKLDELEQSWLQKLHQHCHGKTVFTEIHLALEIRKPAEWQVGLQKIFDIFPDTFVYQNTVIIASNDQQFQSSIYLGMRKCFNQCSDPIRFIDQTTRLCVSELLYKIGKISTKGVQFFNPNSTINNCDISALILQPMVNLDDYVEKGYDQSKKQLQSFIQLQQKQKSVKLRINKLKRQLTFLEHNIKVIKDNNILMQWNIIKAEFAKKADHIFEKVNLEMLKNLLTFVLPAGCIEVIESEGQLGVVSLRINDTIISISRNITNQDFFNQLENILKYIAQQIARSLDVPFKNKFRPPGVSDIENDAKNDDEKIDKDGMLKLIEALQINIINNQKEIQYTQRSFERMTQDLKQIVESNVLQMEKGLKDKNCDMFNFEMAPIKLVMVINDIHEPYFLSYVVQKKQIIMNWILERIDDYEGICEYGAEHAFFRFINWLQISNLPWWIAILRWLSLPVSITNLNLLMQYTRKSVDVHFMNTVHIFGTEIDIIMVVTYFMNIRPKEYQSNPLKFIHNDNQNIKLNMEYNWEKEPAIMKLCESCFQYVINLIPRYKQTTNAAKMGRQIERYMSKNGSKNIKITRDPNDENKLQYSKSNLI